MKPREKVVDVHEGIESTLHLFINSISRKFDRHQGIR